MPRNNGIVVVGSANMDMVAAMRRFPQPGETIFGRSFGMYPGGKGANQAVAAARLGAKVTFLGKMGNDIFRDQLIKTMRHDGVRMEHLLIDSEDPTGIALITVDGKGQNQIVVISGSNMKLLPRDIEAKKQVFALASITLLQLEIPLETVAFAARLAKTHGHTVILNPAPARTLPVSLLKLVDYVTPNETEASLLTGVRIDSMRAAEDAARRLRRMGAKNVILTMGKAGCLVTTASGSTRVRAPKIKAVDTTAAGDALNGALAAALAAGTPLDSAVRFAVDVASITCTTMGAQISLPTRLTVDQFYGEHGEVVRSTTQPVLKTSELDPSIVF